MTSPESSHACADAAAIPTDLRDEEAVRALARGAVDRFGALDVWVNCAGVIAYGRFESVPSEVFRAVIDTNFFGQVHGARAALERFREQGSGVLINMASVCKFAVRAFSECLRHELREHPKIDVATILPQAVDTPIFAHGANYAGRSVRPVPPTVDPDEVARGIVRCARTPQREVTYERAGRALELLHSPPRSTAGSFRPRSSPATTAGGRCRRIPARRSRRGPRLAASTAVGTATGATTSHELCSTRSAVRHAACVADNRR